MESESHPAFVGERYSAVVLAKMGSDLPFSDTLELQWKEIPELQSGSTDVLIKVLAAGINMSDIKETKGAFPFAKVGVVVGRDFCGRVVRSHCSEVPVGALVFGTGGKDRGYSGDGSMAHFALVPAKGLVPLPEALSVLQAGCLGVPYVTAATVVQKAAPRNTDTFVTVGANGFVARCAMNIVKWRFPGITTIGVVRRDVDVPFADTVVNESSENALEAVRSLTGGQGAHVVIDCVGHDVERSIEMLAHGGRLVILSSPTGDTDFRVNIRAFYRKDLTLHSTETMQYDSAASAAILEQLLPGFASGFLSPLPVSAERFHLEDIHRAYAKAAECQGERVVVVPTTTDGVA